MEYSLLLRQRQGFHGCWAGITFLEGPRYPRLPFPGRVRLEDNGLVKKNKEVQLRGHMDKDIWNAMQSAPSAAARKWLAIKAAAIVLVTKLAMTSDLSG